MFKPTRGEVIDVEFAGTLHHLVQVVHISFHTDHNVTAAARDLVRLDDRGYRSQFRIVLGVNARLSNDSFLADLLIAELAYGVQSVVATECASMLIKSTVVIWVIAVGSTVHGGSWVCFVCIGDRKKGRAAVTVEGLLLKVGTTWLGGGGWTTSAAAKSAALMEGDGQAKTTELKLELELVLLLVMVEVRPRDVGRLGVKDGNSVFGVGSSSFVETLPSSSIVRVGSSGGGGSPAGNGIGTSGTKKSPLKPEVHAGGADVIVPVGVDVLDGHDLHTDAVSEGPQNQTGTVVVVPCIVRVTTVFEVNPENEE